MCDYCGLHHDPLLCPMNSWSSQDWDDQPGDTHTGGKR
jgi:hypothetical protein